MKQELKDLLRRHVEQHEHPIDIDDVWNNVESRINKDDNRKAIGYIPFAILGIILFSSVALNWQSITLPSQSVESAPAIDVSNKITSAHSADKIALEENTLNTKTADKTTNSIFSKSQPNSNSKTNLHPDNASPTTDNNIENKTNVLLANHLGTTTHAILPLTSTARRTETKAPIVNKTQAITDKSALLSQLSRLNSHLILVQSTSTHNLPVASSLYVIPNIPQVNRPRPYSLEFWAGSGFATINSTAINSTSPSEQDQFFTGGETYSAGLSIARKISKHLSIYTGVRYEQQYDGIQWDGDYVQNRSGERIDVIGTTDNQESIYNFGQENYFERVSKSIVGYNQLTQLDGVLGLSYNIPITERWSYALKAQLGINITNRYTGHILDSTGIPVAFDERLPMTFNPELATVLQLNYKLNRHLQLGMQLSWSSRQVALPSTLMTRTVYRSNLSLQKLF